MKITIANFGPKNRDKIIGNSLYRICRVYDDSGKWYIMETYNNGKDWAARKYYFSDDLQFVIDRLNAFTTEKEIINLRWEENHEQNY